MNCTLEELKKDIIFEQELMTDEVHLLEKE